jgi:hypothetical protein
VQRRYHEKITYQALSEHISGSILQIITSASLRQDNLSGQIGHPEYHFDACKFSETHSYLSAQRRLLREQLTARPLPSRKQLLKGWRAFGRIIHAVQDFYAHSNYVTLWLESAGAEPGELPPDEIAILVPDLMSNPRLVSGMIYPLELLCYIPTLKPLVLRLLPADSHARMNLDHPGQGPLFDYAQAAAVKHTRHEYSTTAASLDEERLQLFTGRSAC